MLFLQPIYTCANFSATLQQLQLTPDEIWPNCVPTERTLWTAKMFPLILMKPSAPAEHQYCLVDKDGAHIPLSLTDIRSACMWFQYKVDSGIQMNTNGIDMWKASKRLSLCDLLRVGDAFDLRNWRNSLCVFISSPVATRLFCDSRKLECKSMNVPSDCDRFSSFFSETKMLFQQALTDIRRSLFLVPEFIDVANFETEIDKLCFTNNILLALWCWRLNMPKEAPHQLIAIYSKIAVVRIMSICSSRTVLPNSYKRIENIIHLIVHTFLALWNKVPVCFAHELLLDMKMISGPTPPYVWTQIVRGFVDLVDHVDDMNQSRILFILSWLLRASSSKTALTASCDNLSAITKRFMENSSKDMMSDSREAVRAALECVLSMCGNQTLKTSLGFEIEESIEALAQSIVSAQINTSLRVYLSTSPAHEIREVGCLAENDDFPLENVVLASAPARIDLMGGWSDTPPICYQTGGAVGSVILFYFAII